LGPAPLILDKPGGAAKLARFDVKAAEICGSQDLPTNRLPVSTNVRRRP